MTNLMVKNGADRRQKADETTEENLMKTDNAENNSYLCAPMLEKFFKNKRKNDSLVWIPVQCSLLFSEEFQEISPINRCIFVSFLLLCGVRGTLEIPFRINYLSNALGVNRKTLSKGIDELIGVNLLHKTERKKEEKESTAQTAQTDSEIAAAVAAAAVGAASENLFKSEDAADERNGQATISALRDANRAANSGENSGESFSQSPDDAAKNGAVKTDDAKTDEQKNADERRSEFSLEDCLKYVEQCAARGEAIKNVQGLARHLHRTGEADAFIRHALFPEKQAAEQAALDRQQYGAPRNFTTEPCAQCYDAKMADPDGKGYRRCPRCRNERGFATGREPADG